MSLKQLNLSWINRPVPRDWTPDKRFVSYPYAPFHVPTHTLPQEPMAASPTSTGLRRLAATIEGSNADADEERDFRIAMKRRSEPAGTSLDDIGKKYGL